MKRIAIELYGLTRSYKETFDSFFFNLLQPLYGNGYIVDVFIHTWSESDSKDITWHNPSGENRGINLNNLQYNDIAEKYRPKKIVIDKPLNIPQSMTVNEKLCKRERSLNSLISCFYSRYSVNKLRKIYEKENKLKYDFVILTRFDICFHKPLLPDYYLKTYENYSKINSNPDAIYTSIAPFKMTTETESENTECCTDLIVFSSPSSMDIIVNFYTDLNLGIINNNFIEENNYTIEVLWRKYWKSKGLEHIKIKYIESEDFHIVRCDNCKAAQYENLNYNKKYSRKLRNNIKDIWLYFKPFFSWLSEIFFIIYYISQIFIKILQRLNKCI